MPSNCQHSALCLPFPLAYSQQEQLVRYASRPRSCCPLDYSPPACNPTSSLSHLFLPTQKSMPHLRKNVSLLWGRTLLVEAWLPLLRHLSEHLSLLFRIGERIKCEDGGSCSTHSADRPTLVSGSMAVGLLARCLLGVLCEVLLILPSTSLTGMC